jgi:hypothetical protein
MEARTIRRFHSRALLALVAVAVMVAALGLWLRTRRASDAAEHVLSAAPPDAWLIVTVDVAAAWPLLEPVVGSTAGLSGASRIAGLGTVSSACGFEPLEHIRRLMVALPEHGERGDFGVAVDGDLPVDALVTCARKAIAASGGKPGGRTRGDFALVSNDTGPEAASVAYRPGGPFLIGRGPWLDAMIDAVDGKTAHSSPSHDALRRALVGSAPGAGTTAGLVVTALLPSALRDRLASEAADAGEAPAPNGAFAGILGVREAGLSIVAHGPWAAPSASTGFDLELRCDTPQACADVKKLIERERFALSGDFRARLLGLGPLIDGLSFGEAPGAEAPPDTQGGARSGLAASLSVRTRAPTGDLARMLSRLLGRAAAPAPAPATALEKPAASAADGGNAN